MGLIRLLLAVSVVIAHTGPVFGFTLVGGKIAVQSFFIISGFYMALILHEKYTGKNSSYKLYITNRLLRIFPLYWIIFTLTCLFLLLFHDGARQFLYFTTAYHPLTVAYLIVTNVFIIGQDIGMFLELNNDRLLYFSTAYEGTTPFVFLHLLIPQGWTLAVELSFYLIAPFLVKRKLWILVLIAAASFGLRYILYSQGLHHEPWTNRFFPTELFFFLLGILAYRIYKRFPVTLPKRFILLIYSIFISLLLCFSFLPKLIGVIDVFQWVFYLALACSLPLFFYSFQSHQLDAFWGELAYPVFVSHILIIRIIDITLPESLSPLYGIIIIILTLLFSMLLLKVLEPLQRLRQKRIIGWKRKQ